MVPKIIERGVRSLENNQAVIDREAWFKARLLLFRLTSYVLVMGREHVPVWTLAPKCSHLWWACWIFPIECMFQIAQSPPLAES